jgi:hypothetical protein
MSAILFGSVNSIVDTSKLQRQAFSQAFQACELDWCWHLAEDLKMLENK